MSAEELTPIFGKKFTFEAIGVVVAHLVWSLAEVGFFSGVVCVPNLTH